MSNYTLEKRYDNHHGLDLKSSDLTRPIQFSSKLKNCQFRKSGSIEKRKGYQGHAASEGGHGLFVYQKKDQQTGAITQEVITVSDSAHKLETVTLTVTYAGADPTCLFSVFFDVATDQYRCQILEGANLVVDEALGIGFDEASPYEIDDLATVINGVANFTATVTGDGTTPAALLKTVRTHDLASTGGAVSTEAKYWSELNKTVSAPFAGSEANKNSLTFENASATNLNNVLYIANGYDYIQKYDGQTLYRAGLPDVGSISAALVGGGAITGSNYLHVAQYIQLDNAGNLIEGNALTSTTPLTAAAQSFDVTVANIQAGSGFNTNCAIVDGAQVTVNTITVDNGSGGSHTLKVGDTAYFFDSVSSAFVEREVTAVSATTITIAGAAVTVSDNAVISNNLRIAIFRSKTSGTTPTTFFLVAEIPNNSFTATQVYNDNLTDAQLGAQFIEPLTDRSAPPKGKYISSFQTILVIAGNIEEPNTVYYSDIESPEYFPVGTNSFLVENQTGDIITGIAPNNNLFVIFKEKSIHTVTGEIATAKIRVDLLTVDIGCVAHASIQELRGALAFLSSSGPYIMIGGQIPTSLGNDRIEPVFDENEMTIELREELFNTQIYSDEISLQNKRAVAINHGSQEKYILYIPCESTQSGDRYSNANSKCLVYDYQRDAWLIWDNMNMAGGVVELDQELYFVERRYSSFNSSVDHVLYRRHNLGDAYDYQDNTASIDFMYASQWEALGEPSVFKKFLTLRVFALETSKNNEFMLTVDTEANYTKGSSKASFDLSLGGAGYGESAYGVAPYGDPAENAVKHKLSNGKFRSLRFIFTNNEEQANVILTGWEVQIAPVYDRIMKS